MQILSKNRALLLFTLLPVFSLQAYSDEIIRVNLDGIHKKVVWGSSGDTRQEYVVKFTKTWDTINGLVENASRTEDDGKLHLKLYSNKTQFEKNSSVLFTLMLENFGDKKMNLSFLDINSASIILRIKDNKQNIIFREQRREGIRLSDKTISLGPKENISFTFDIGTWQVKPEEGNYNEATYLKNTSGSYTITAIYSSYIMNKQVWFGQVESNSADFEITAPPASAHDAKNTHEAKPTEKSVPALEISAAIVLLVITFFLKKEIL